MEEQINKSYYAIIPANVRYDKNLTANAKLLYAEITALTNEKGYCWASNSYFAELYGVSTNSISNWLKNLRDGGYIKMIYEYTEGTAGIKKRYIYLADKAYAPKKDEKETEEIKENTPQKNLGHPPKKFGASPQKKLEDNNTFNNTSNNTDNTTTTSNEVVVDEIDISKKCKKVIDIYYKAGFGNTSEYVKENLLDFANNYPINWIEDAFRISTQQNKLKLSYVNAILQNWHTNGRGEKPKPKGKKTELEEYYDKVDQWTEEIKREMMSNEY